MSEKTLITYCAPTLAGIKTGNLFAYIEPSREKMNRDIKNFNRMFNKKGLVLKVLGEKGGRWLVYVYRPSALKRDLERKKSRKILESFGYEDINIDIALNVLGSRIKTESVFPHEIGLFLGYPPEDVLGFIEHGGKNAKKSGLWKVYGDANEAEKTFEQYRRCTHIYSNRHDEGESLQRLLVCTN